MSTAIIKFENNPKLMFYCKNHSYPAGLGFDLYDRKDKDIISYLTNNTNRFEIVKEIPLDIQYEYILKNDGEIHCQESWYAKDKAYHGGGFRHGGIYNLGQLKEKLLRQEEYSYRTDRFWSPYKKI